MHAHVDTTPLLGEVLTGHGGEGEGLGRAGQPGRRQLHRHLGVTLHTLQQNSPQHYTSIPARTWG